MVASHYARTSRPASAFADMTNEIVIVVCAVLVVSVAARDVRGGRSWLRGRILVTLGEISYSFYLVHATVVYFALGVLGHQLPIGWSNLTWYALLLVASTVVAAGLHYGVERPLERRIRRTWDARRLARRAALTPTGDAG